MIEIQKEKEKKMIKKNLNILAKSLCIEMDLWLMMVHSETILTQKIKNSWMNLTKSTIPSDIANMNNLFFLVMFLLNLENNILKVLKLESKIERNSSSFDLIFKIYSKHDYELPPPPKYVAFSGSGTTLTTGASSQKSSSVPVQQDNIQPQPPKVNLLKYQTKSLSPKIDNDKPITRIMIRLHDGKSEEVQVNYDTKVSDVFTYVWSLTPHAGEFELIAGFPPKPITNVNQTIEEAGLEDSKVIQKLL